MGATPPRARRRHRDRELPDSVPAWLSHPEPEPETHRLSRQGPRLHGRGPFFLSSLLPKMRGHVALVALGALRQRWTSSPRTPRVAVARRGARLKRSADRCREAAWSPIGRDPAARAKSKEPPPVREGRPLNLAACGEEAPPPASLVPATEYVYARRKPEQTVLHRVLSAHLEMFLSEVRSEGGRGLPRYVERELRDYLKCGIPAHGFLHARCKDCGKEMVVAFSCKRRGVCPSCAARRMCSTAAHLVDHVLPDVPVRQWVLSVPWELRLLLARRADAFGALIRLFAREVTDWQRAVVDNAQARGGGITFPQRFGGSLNLNTHVHAVFPDGVFVRDSRRWRSALRATSCAHVRGAHAPLRAHSPTFRALARSARPTPAARWLRPSRR